MNEPNLISVCLIAFVAVMLLLGFQALVIRLISRFFPERKSERDLFTEAIQSAIESRFPGAKVVALEETKPTRAD